MAAGYDFFITGEQDAAKGLVASALGSDGFAVEGTPNGGLVASRGSVGKTLLLGGLAGKGLHMRFDVQFFVDDQQRTVARLSRNLGTGAIKGGAIGAAKTAEAFQNLSHVVGTALSGAGVLAATTEF